RSARALSATPVPPPRARRARPHRSARTRQGSSRPRRAARALPLELAGGVDVVDRGPDFERDESKRVAARDLAVTPLELLHRVGFEDVDRAADDRERHRTAGK